MPHPNYLSSHRLRWALSKRELALLIGYMSGNPVSRCESGLRSPTLKFVLGCEIVFGESAKTLFPGLYAEVEDMVLVRAASLDEQVRDHGDPISVRKRELLIRMAERAGNATLA